MIEVLRSKVYYASARSMVILPKFSPLLQLPGQAVIMPLFNSVLRLLDKRSKEGSASATMAHQAMMSIQQSGQVGRDDRLCHWMKAECWIGMAVLILTSGWKPMEDAFYSLVASREISMLRLQCKPINHVLLFSSGRVQALIHPGGSGTVASALSWGIPQVLFPLHHDQWRSSERLIDLKYAPSSITSFIFHH